MSRLPESGVCMLAIDLTTDHGTLNAPQHSGPVQLAKLRQALTDSGIPVTWSIDPTQAGALELLLPQHDGDEIALCAAPTWAKHESDRRAFGEGLAHRLSMLASAGYQPSTLVLRKGTTAPHHDLLVKHGIQVVRVIAGRPGKHARGGWWRRRSDVPTQPFRLLRWGLWEAIPAVDLDRDGVRVAGRTIDRIAASGCAAIVAASAQSLASNDRTATRLIRHLVRQHNEGGLRLATISSCAGTLQAGRSAVTARSILRSAAA